MIVNALYLILPGILFGLSFHLGEATPTNYDQRQSGEYNIDAKFENFLIVIATSGTNDLLNNLATQALELKELVSESNLPKDDIEESSETVVYETEDRNRGREPYHVEIIRIDKESESSTKNKDIEKAKKPESEEKENINSKASLKEVNSSEKLLERSKSSDKKEEDKRGRSLWRHDAARELVDSFEKGNEREKPIVKKSNNIEYLEQSDEISIKEENLKATKPGMLLKKQLSRKEDEDVSLPSDERNDVGSSEIKPQELKLLGGGIENCGPGRYRDKSGVCQFDKNFK